LLFGIYLAKKGTDAVRPWPRSAMSTAVGCVVAAVVYGVVIGKVHGGLLRFALTEVRPFVYLAATFVLASVLVTTRAALRAVLWAIVIAVGLVTLLAVAHATLPRRRRVIGRILITLVVVGSIYVPAYWNKSGGLAQPARAIRTAFAPGSARDTSSDLYRIQEDENLWL